jgi:type IV secretory pathway VirB10-like protein
MSELMPKDEELLRGARSGWDPPAGAEDRVLTAVLAKVGPPAPPDGSGNAPPNAPPVAGVAKAWLAKGALVALAALGGGAVIHRLATRAPETPPAAVAAASASAAPPDLAPPAPAPSASAPAPPPSASAPPAPPVERSARPRPATTASSAAPDLDTLRRETALMREAQKALRDGHPERALEVLDQHAGSHPGGVLVEERLAARVQALCLAGKVPEARAALAELRKVAPRSPQLARLAGSCAGR